MPFTQKNILANSYTERIIHLMNNPWEKPTYRNCKFIFFCRPYTPAQPSRDFLSVLRLSLSLSVMKNNYKKSLFSCSVDDKRHVRVKSWWEKYQENLSFSFDHGKRLAAVVFNNPGIFHISTFMLVSCIHKSSKVSSERELLLLENVFRKLCFLWVRSMTKFSRSIGIEIK